MARIIQVKYIIVNSGNFEGERVVRVPESEQIAIGRGDLNQIRCKNKILSRDHGKIYIKGGVFKRHLMYEDTSTYGSTILHWKGAKVVSKHLKQGKTKLRPGDWILILYEGLTGLILIPTVE